MAPVKPRVRDVAAGERGLLQRKAGRRRKVIVAAAAASSLLAAYFLGQYALLRLDGVQTRALSMRPERQAIFGKTAGPAYWYYLNYAFADGQGRRREGRQTIDRDRYAALAGGKFVPAIDVYYSRALPFVSALDLRQLRTVGSVLALLAALGWAAIVVGHMRRTW